MRSLRVCFNAPDFELEPIALLQMMNASVKRQQELEPRGLPPDNSYHLVI